MFPGYPLQSAAGDVPVWKAHVALKELAKTVDLVVARVDTVSARLFFGAGFLRVPEWVDAVLPVPADLDALVWSRRSVREDMRVVRNNRLDASISHAEQEFEDFYSTMYTPFIQARHGNLAWISNRESLRKCFRRGGLIWLIRSGERIAGILFERNGRPLHLPAEGTRGGDPSLLKNGAISALFYHAIRHAADCRCAMVDFGGCRPCLTDGVLRYKRKWGMELRTRSMNQFCTLVCWNRWNPAVGTFLSDVPVLHQHQGRLTAIASAGLSRTGSQADADRSIEALHMRGVDRFVLVNEAGWESGVTPPPSCVLASGKPLPQELTAP